MEFIHEDEEDVEGGPLIGTVDPSLDMGAEDENEGFSRFLWGILAATPAATEGGGGWGIQYK